MSRVPNPPRGRDGQEEAGQETETELGERGAEQPQPKTHVPSEKSVQAQDNQLRRGRAPEAAGAEESDATHLARCSEC